MKVVTNVILHIGAGKCGSSALQTVLSQNPELGISRDGSVRYASIQSNGELL